MKRYEFLELVRELIIKQIASEKQFSLSEDDFVLEDSMFAFDKILVIQDILVGFRITVTGRDVLKISQQDDFDNSNKNLVYERLVEYEYWYDELNEELASEAARKVSSLLNNVVS